MPDRDPMQRFLADRMLGKLAKWLRVLGYDTAYLRRGADEDIRAGLRGGRILLTRNRRAEAWAGQGGVVAIEANDPWEQLQEVVRKLELRPAEEMLFSRCLRCNLVLTPVEKQEVESEVPEYIWQTHRRFSRCPGCGRIYWAGTHAKRMRQRLHRLSSISG